MQRSGAEEANGDKKCQFHDPLDPREIEDSKGEDRSESPCPDPFPGLGEGGLDGRWDIRTQCSLMVIPIIKMDGKSIPNPTRMAGECTGQDVQTAQGEGGNPHRQLNPSEEGKPGEEEGDPSPVGEEEENQNKYQRGDEGALHIKAEGLCLREGNRMGTCEGDSHSLPFGERRSEADPFQCLHQRFREGEVCCWSNRFCDDEKRILIL